MVHSFTQAKIGACMGQQPALESIFPNIFIHLTLKISSRVPCSSEWYQHYCPVLSDLTHDHRTWILRYLIPCYHPHIHGTWRPTLDLFIHSHLVSEKNIRLSAISTGSWNCRGKHHRVLIIQSYEVWFVIENVFLFLGHIQKQNLIHGINKTKSHSNEWL